MRSLREIHFRMRQELANLRLWMLPPRLMPAAPTPWPAFPHPEHTAAAARHSAWARQTLQLADQILAGQLPLLGLVIHPGSRLAWRRDYLNGKETPPIYFRCIPYLDPSRAGDHKIIWEMNRHQHLVLMAHAWLLSNQTRYRDYVFQQLEDWQQENPFQCGINWASALEVAFRALSWIWIYHLLGRQMSASFQTRFLNTLACHGYHLQHNLSFYFSPNTHLLGEAVVLHTLGLFFAGCEPAQHWRTLGRSVVLHELARQVQADGSHFEHSSYYHLYALDFFLFHHLLEPLPDPSPLQKMARYLAALTGPSQLLPFLGDDDGGRLFYPFGDRARFARATLATASVLFKERFAEFAPEDLLEQALWWIGPSVVELCLPPPPPLSSTLFPSSGVAVFCQDQIQLLVDAGPFGWGSAGHSHSDTLSLLLRVADAEILIDPGTYTYIGPERDLFRSSAAHNTLRLDEVDQATPAGPFRWRNPPEVEIHAWQSSATIDFLDASCRYRGLRHRRQVWFYKPDSIFVLDTVEGSGTHQVEQFWHSAQPITALSPQHWRLGDFVELATDSPGEILPGWRAPALGAKSPAPFIRLQRLASLPLQLKTVIRIGGQIHPDLLSLPFPPPGRTPF